MVNLNTNVREYPSVDLWPIMENGYGDGSQNPHPDATGNNNGGNDPFGPTFTDLHSLGQNGTMWGIYYSQAAWQMFLVKHTEMVPMNLELIEITVVLIVERYSGDITIR